MTTPLITGTDFVSLPTQDFEAAAEFYGDVLGLPLTKRYSRAIGGEVETGSLTIQLLEMEKIGREFKPTTSSAIALHVDDVETARAELESRGVSFHGETMDSGVCHMAFFTDRDGNRLILHHRYAPPGVLPPD
jgi:catechol 2,3-dioxygenase-like lactoylglutathione lyase family enzyme